MENEESHIIKCYGLATNTRLGKNEEHITTIQLKSQLKRDLSILDPENFPDIGFIYLNYSLKLGQSFDVQVTLIPLSEEQLKLMDEPGQILI